MSAAEKALTVLGIVNLAFLLWILYHLITAYNEVKDHSSRITDLENARQVLEEGGKVSRQDLVRLKCEVNELAQLLFSLECDLDKGTPDPDGLQCVVRTERRPRVFNSPFFVEPEDCKY